METLRLSTTAKFVLISGIPRAGKSSLSDAIEEADLGFTHVPLDRYVRPIPPGFTLLDWLRTPACVAWDMLAEHIEVLESGRHCFSPRPDWSERGTWVSSGGCIEDGPGRRMEPPSFGYLIPGTHSFAFLAPEGNAARIFIDTEARILAERLKKEPVPAADAEAVIFRHLGSNPAMIESQKVHADLIVSGSAAREEQLTAFQSLVAEFFGDFNHSR